MLCEWQFMRYFVHLSRNSVFHAGKSVSEDELIKKNNNINKRFGYKFPFNDDENRSRNVQWFSWMGKKIHLNFPTVHLISLGVIHSFSLMLFLVPVLMNTLSFFIQ